MTDISRFSITDKFKKNFSVEIMTLRLTALLVHGVSEHFRCPSTFVIQASAHAEGITAP